MKLEIRNFQKIKEADIKIEGITLIAGKNDTGKSTSSKWLYSILFSTFGKEQILNSNMNTVFAEYLMDNFADFSVDMKNSDIREFIGLILSFKREDFSINEVLSKFEKVFKNDSKYKKIQSSANKINREILEDFMSEKVFYNIIENEFQNQLTKGSIVKLIKNSDEKTKILEFEIEENNTRRVYINDKEMDRLKFINVIYIESPFVLERSLLVTDSDEVFSNFSYHSRDLFKMLFKTRQENIFDDSENKMLEIIEKMLKGKLVFENDRHTRTVEFIDNENNKCKLSNIATGIKVIGMIQKLLENGSMRKNNIVIIDEPEVHLHPEWQVFFVELMILIHKEMNVKFYINTHSPYIIESLQVYSKLYKDVNINYYLAEKEGNQSKISEVKEKDIKKIYNSLSEPYEILDDLVMHNNTV